MLTRLFIFVCAGFFGGFTLLATASQAETLRIAGAGNAKFSFARGIAQGFVPSVKKGSGNRLDVQLFWGSQLGSLEENIQQTRNGTVFGTVASSAYFNSYVPELGVTNLPFLFNTRDAAFRVFDGPLGAELSAKMADKGFIVLGFFELGFRQITNRVRAIKAPGDLKGLKIRLQPNPVHLATFKSFGAIPVQMGIKELFSALRQGVLDGQENPFVFINLLKLHEANQKFISDTGHFYDIMLFVASKKVFNSMAGADQALIRKAGAEATALQRKLSATDNESGKAQLVKNGMMLTELTAAQRDVFRKRSAPIYKQIEERLGRDLVRRFVAAAQN